MHGAPSGHGAGSPHLGPISGVLLTGMAAGDGVSMVYLLHAPREGSIGHPRSWWPCRSGLATRWLWGGLLPIVGDHHTRGPDPPGIEYRRDVSVTCHCLWVNGALGSCPLGQGGAITSGGDQNILCYLYFIEISIYNFYVKLIAVEIFNKHYSVFLHLYLLHKCSQFY